MRSSKGQASVEFVLMATAIVAITMAITQDIRDKGYLAQFVDGPWSLLQGMTKHGVWALPQQAANKDPGLSPRRGTMQGVQEN